ncbi:hypothetical protein A33Q_1244 [Indibacter alkaliphilus LW1]|uniref:Uncharacterized protein n=1 Tax=Indibacter alkaliphilus (strain CCUG 57479 / KCTC 22604 / LW1) TaxID=1189612 RepID=S2DN20_INDAL|nr:hypothetical protein [Indibacter alkaliphilus]EOZ98590.1 hypothetical protein A33Q_1244 [Indibacter alkaliphilus LW1]
MKFKDVILLHEDFLADFGFQLDGRSLHYIKTIEEGRQMVFFHYTHHEDVSYLEYHLGIRYDKVENIVHRFLPSLGDYKERSITLVETMDRIHDEMPRRFLVENDNELGPVIATAEDFLVKKGFRFLDKYSEGAVLESYFNRETSVPILTQNFTYRSARGITLAKFYNPDSFEEIKSKYLDMLNEKQVTPFNLACFINLIDYLEHL